MIDASKPNAYCTMCAARSLITAAFPSKDNDPCEKTLTGLFVTLKYIVQHNPKSLDNLKYAIDYSLDTEACKQKRDFFVDIVTRMVNSDADKSNFLNVITMLENNNNEDASVFVNQLEVTHQQNEMRRRLQEERKKRNYSEHVQRKRLQCKPMLEDAIEELIKMVRNKDGLEQMQKVVKPLYPTHCFLEAKRLFHLIKRMTLKKTDSSKMIKTLEEIKRSDFSDGVFRVAMTLI